MGEGYHTYGSQQATVGNKIVMALKILRDLLDNNKHVTYLLGKEEELMKMLKRDPYMYHNDPLEVRDVVDLDIDK